MINNKMEFEEELRLIRAQANCPACDKLSGNLTGLTEYECNACMGIFTISDMEQTRIKLTESKLITLSRFQVENTTMASFMDINFDPDKFVDREDLSFKLNNFIKSKRDNFFLLLGEAGFGKTWSVSNIARRYKESNGIVFYISLKKGISHFFDLTFGMNSEDVMLSIQNIATKLNTSILWIFDGYDEGKDDIKTEVLQKINSWLDRIPIKKLNSRLNYNFESLHNNLDDMIKNRIIEASIDSKGTENIEDDVLVLGKREIKKYNSVELFGDQIDILLELEKRTGKIPIKTKINWDTFGFTHTGKMITGIGLYKKGLESFPESISGLINLQILYLHNNKLNSLPESIGKLVNLQRLWLSNNKLNSLPESIGQLTNLTYLGLIKNQLNSLPESIGQLTNLTYLGLNNNKLNSLPESISKLVNLQKLWIQENQLNSLPKSIDQLTNLTYLDLSNNELNSLPKSVKNSLRKLKSNRCSVNGINL